MAATNGPVRTTSDVDVNLLVDAGLRLPDDLRRKILERGDDVVPALVELLEDFDVRVTGWASEHAATLLGELGATEAIEPMLGVLAKTDWQAAVHERLILALPKIGPAIVEPALRAWQDNDDTCFRESVATVLAEVGVRDERIFAVLLDELRASPSMGASDLAVYGDPAALPYLSGALDDYEVVATDNPLANHAVIELRAAIEDLGGILTADQQRKIHRARGPADRLRERIDATLDGWSRRITVEPASRKHLPGRNEPCRCGSGRKYKKCCLRADEGYAT